MVTTGSVINAWLEIAGRFYLVKTVLLRLRNVFIRLADDRKRLLNFLS
jgi:hypothetical protein